MTREMRGHEAAGLSAALNISAQNGERPKGLAGSAMRSVREMWSSGRRQHSATSPSTWVAGTLASAPCTVYTRRSSGARASSVRHKAARSAVVMPAGSPNSNVGSATRHVPMLQLGCSCEAGCARDSQLPRQAQPAQLRQPRSGRQADVHHARAVVAEGEAAQVVYKRREEAQVVQVVYKRTVSVRAGSGAGG